MINRAFHLMANGIFLPTHKTRKRHQVLLSKLTRLRSLFRIFLQPLKKFISSNQTLPRQHPASDHIADVLHQQFLKPVNQP